MKPLGTRGTKLFLVLYRGGCDDIPLRVFDDQAEAEKYAQKLVRFYDGWEFWDEKKRDRYFERTKRRYRPHHPDLIAATDALGGLDIGTFCNITMLELVDGKPKGSWCAGGVL